MTMNIYAGNGDFVIFKNPTNGTDHDIAKFEKYLELYKTYEVLKTVVDRMSSDVILKDFPGIYFNTVGFEDYEVDTERANERAAKWSMYGD